MNIFCVIIGILCLIAQSAIIQDRMSKIPVILHILRDILNPIILLLTLVTLMSQPKDKFIMFS